jgi:hypothetical protein
MMLMKVSTHATSTGEVLAAEGGAFEHCYYSN